MFLRVRFYTCKPDDLVKKQLKRAIQKYIEDPLAEEIINSSLKEGDTIYLDLEEGKEELSVVIKKTKATKKISE